MKFLRIAATMNGKFESNSNNYDESNLNRLCGASAATGCGRASDGVCQRSSPSNALAFRRSLVSKPSVNQS
jgi:hypothetical protein